MKWVQLPIGEIFSLEKGSLQSSKAVPGKYIFITAAEEWKTHKAYTHDCEALVYAVAASGSLGRAHYVKGQFVASDLCFIMRAKNPAKYPVNFKFYQFLFSLMRKQIVSSTKTGTSKEAINQKNFSKYPIPYIDFDHQNQWQTKLSTLSGILEKQDDQFDTQSAYLTQLRQAILQEAIEGKLTAEWRAKQSEGTERNENNDAAVLLEKIKAEKAALVAKGKIKKEKPLPPIEPGEVPFALPEGWAWTRLGELTESITYGTSEKCSYDSSKNAKVLRIPNVSSGIIDGTDLKFTRLSKKEMQELSLKYGDILTIRSNGSPEIVGTMAFVTEAFENYCFAGYLIRLRFHSPLIGHFLSKVSRAKSIRAQIEDPLRTTVGINNINTQELSSLKFPLPPLAEQHAIVERVDRLLAMVDQLEQQVAERKVQAEELMQAVLREAFSQDESGTL